MKQFSIVQFTYKKTYNESLRECVGYFDFKRPNISGFSTEQVKSKVGQKVTLIIRRVDEFLVIIYYWMI